MARPIFFHLGLLKSGKCSCKYKDFKKPVHDKSTTNPPQPNQTPKIPTLECSVVYTIFYGDLNEFKVKQIKMYGMYENLLKPLKLSSFYYFTKPVYKKLTCEKSSLEKAVKRVESCHTLTARCYFYAIFSIF